MTVIKLTLRKTLKFLRSLRSIFCQYNPLFFHYLLFYPNQIFLMWQIRLRSQGQGNRLRNKILFRPWLRIIVRPSVYRWNFSRPVTMTGFYRSGPFQRIRSPWIMVSLSSPIHAIEEVEEENELCKESDNSRYRHKHV